MKLEKISQEIRFKVKAYTFFNINLGYDGDYFSTTAKARGCEGQCQQHVLDGLALAFFNRYDQYHLKPMSAIPESEILNMLEDIEILKQNYNYEIMNEKISRERNIETRKEKPINIGEYQNRKDLTIKEIIDKVNLFKDLKEELEEPKNVVSRRMKI